MTIVITYSDKCKQVIRTSDSFKEKKTQDEMNRIANNIARDLSYGTYLKTEVKD